MKFYNASFKSKRFGNENNFAIVIANNKKEAVQKAIDAFNFTHKTQFSPLFAKVVVSVR